MTIMDTIRQFFGRPSSGPSAVTAAKIDAAIEAADAVAKQSREVNDKLKGYLDRPDPFMSLLVDIHNERATRAQLRQWDQ